MLLEILVFSLGIGYKMRRQQREKLEAERDLNRELSKINTAFGRFVPHEFISSLGYDSVVDVKLGDQVKKEVTVLFSDIRGYTTLSEQMTPAENFRFLNAYLGQLGPVIQQRRPLAPTAWRSWCRRWGALPRGCGGSRRRWSGMGGSEQNYVFTN